MSLVEPSKKRKRVSKNKKRNWAKTDITDVEEHLESNRLQIRTGGIAEDKSDKQLFFVDKKTKKETKATGGKRKRGEPRPLKCHSILELDTTIKPVIVSHNIPTNNIKNKCDRAVTRSASGPKVKEVKAQEQRKQTLQLRRQQRDEKKKRITQNVDLWPQEAVPISDLALLTKKQPVKVPISVKRKVTSELPAIDVAHPGQSYNPALDDHQDLLRAAVEVEVKKAKLEARIIRAVDGTFPLPKDAPTEASYIQEMSAGLFDLPDATEEEEGTAPSNPPVRRENKKTERQRKKLEANKKKALQRQKLKEEKMRAQNLFRLKSLKNQIKTREAELTERAQKKVVKMEETKNDPKTLGPYKYADPNISLKLSSELEGSLRLLKPEGSLALDRFKSFQKRNIIEPRIRSHIKRKYKLKSFEKKKHKAVDITLKE